MLKFTEKRRRIGEGYAERLWWQVWKWGMQEDDL
jgi:hypothetical protein